MPNLLPIEDGMILEPGMHQSSLDKGKGDMEDQSVRGDAQIRYSGEIGVHSLLLLEIAAQHTWSLKLTTVATMEKDL